MLAHRSGGPRHEQAGRLHHRRISQDTRALEAKFIVAIDDVGHAGFQKCSELSVEVSSVQYFEGGSLIPNKSPGRLTFCDVTLERGASEDPDLLDWFLDVAITSSGLGVQDVQGPVFSCLMVR